MYSRAVVSDAVFQTVALRTPQWRRQSGLKASVTSSLQPSAKIMSWDATRTYVTSVGALAITSAGVSGSFCQR